ncbi:MAG: UbiA family prenyltransferase, partial [Verrucomicrobiota bacterium]|nr:UbiA family prenyltransferase [Verrucomicrobiota bacterium]
MSLLGHLLALGRVSNLPTVWSNACAAYVFNASVGPTLRAMPSLSAINPWEDSTLPFLLLGASLVYMGGCTLNDAVDEKFDALHNPDRPIPSGALSSSAVWMIGLAELVLGAWAMIEGADCSALWVVLLLIALLAYDLLHKKWKGSFILMGSCRLFLWAGAATAGGMTAIAPQTWIWGLALMAYVMGITIHAREEASDRSDAHRL